MSFISCYLLLTRATLVGKVSVSKRNDYDLRCLNQNKRSIKVYGKSRKLLKQKKQMAMIEKYADKRQELKSRRR